jgi:hypothetical protein
MLTTYFQLLLRLTKRPTLNPHSPYTWRSGAYKCKGHPLRSIEAHVGERRYSPSHSLTTALEGGEWLAGRPGRIYPREDPRYPLYRRLGWPRAGLDAETRGKILCLCRGSNPGRPARGQTLCWLSYPAHNGVYAYRQIQLYYYNYLATDTSRVTEVNFFCVEQ